MSVIKGQKARKDHRCDSCRGHIKPGEMYVTHVALAGDDYYHDARDRDTWKPLNQPIRLKECGDCAGRYGRAELLIEKEKTA